MAISLKHQFTSPKADGGDSTLVQPSNWNAEHTMTLTSGYLVGRTTAGVGAAEEISVGSNLSLSGGTLTLASSLTATSISVTSITYNSVPITATAAEINYLSGVTSALQTQLNAKAPLASPTFSGTITSDILYVDSSDADTAGAPAIAFATDTDTGIFHAAADTIGITTGGGERFRVNVNGAIGIGGANYGAAGQVLQSGGSGATVAWVDKGLILLGTLTTTSGATQTLAGLDLSTYKTLQCYFSGVGHSSSTAERFDATNISSAFTGPVYGFVTIDLTDGSGISLLGQASTSGIIYGVNTSYSTATTSISFSVAAGTYNAGKIYVFGAN